MNNVQINFNSYVQTAQILINGREPSVYSDLANYTYQHFSQAPDIVLDAIARELNDDFTLAVCGNLFECSLYSAAVTRNSYCAGCEATSPAVQMSSQKRAKHLDGILSSKVFNVGLFSRDGVSVGIPSAPLCYGSVSLCFTKEPHQPLDLEFQISNDAVSICVGTSIVSLPRSVFNGELLVSACETYLINPAIGQAVVRTDDATMDIAICSRLTPIVSAEFPAELESGAKADLAVTCYPPTASHVKIAIVSSDPDIISVDGLIATANNPGTTVVQAYIAGENKPFYSQNVVVRKTIYASSLVIEALDNPIHEGAVIPLRVTTVPVDASDANAIKWVSSDPAIAVVRDGNLIAKGSGSCIIRAKTAHVHADVKISVVPILRSIKISDPEVITNVGRSVPITVSAEPAGAFNVKYTWETSDNSVAVVVKEDGQEVIKAVGIGDCVITCVSEDGNLRDECQVHVESLMYKKKKKSSPLPFLFVAIFLVILWGGMKIIGSKDLSDPYLTNADVDRQLPNGTGTDTSELNNEPEYLKDPSLISDDVIAELAAHAISVQTAKNEAKTGGFAYSDVVFCAATLSLPGEYNRFPRYENSIDIFICYEGSMSGGGTSVHHVYYTPMHFKNITVNEDGTLNINVNDGTFASYFTNDLDSSIEHLSDGGSYTVTRIG